MVSSTLQVRLQSKQHYEQFLEVHTAPRILYFLIIIIIIIIK